MDEKKRQEQGKKRGKGSILVGMILIFILISSIALAVINRSMHGAQLAVDSKKGYSAYQASDSNTENILNNIKKLDSENLRIPENTPASAVCDGICYKSDQNNLAEKVSEIFFIKKEGKVQNLERVIFAPVPDRVDNPVVISSVSLAGISCVSITLTLLESSTQLCDNISQFEVRKSSDANLSEGEWGKITEVDCNSVIEAGGSIIAISGVGLGEYVTIKAKNKNSFNLDSNYADPVKCGS